VPTFGGPHGGEFTYRSADSDMLGWACERASGTRMADLISALVWQPIWAERDAEITCDPLGSAIPDGGVSATAPSFCVTAVRRDGVNPWGHEDGRSG
jgi:CubicO group peptidase (beta-lactamase class C family)